MKNVLKNKNPFDYFTAAPAFKDAVILCFFTVLVVFQPFFLYGQINIFEVGLYLPGINAILHGMVPYRDFFHLRGPFELYMPAGLMSLFGAQLSVLSAYFYFGTVLCLLVCVGIGKELYRTRGIFYLMVPVLVARTFPRVFFTWWGGMRYAFGLLVIYCLVKFLKCGRKRWLFFAGVFSACAFFTSIEIGVLSTVSVFAALVFLALWKLQEKMLVVKSAAVFLSGAAAVTLPYLFYLLLTQSLVPFIDSVHTVLFLMGRVIDNSLVSQVPDTFGKALAAMVNPGLENFRQMTPMYTYLILLGYLLYRARRQRLSRTDAGLVCLGVYGFSMHIVAIKNIWAAQFEMALQPEKIILFFMLEEAYFWLQGIKQRAPAAIRPVQPAGPSLFSARLKVYGINLLFAGCIISSLAFSAERYHKRFFAFQWLRDAISGKDCSKIIPLATVPSRPLALKRAQGMVVPVDQAEELDAVIGFLEKNTTPQETILMYPELGTYSFLADRPFPGRFPIPTFSWFNERWHREFMSDLKVQPPRFVVLAKELKSNWMTVYFAVKESRDNYAQVMDFITSNYRLRTATPASYIYELKQ
ncbi:MAG TPA: hypothetical protein PL155_06675 [Candidatus Omnitrophota bacterium]|nr:hypothetical protein [Candidatus Omnitrophota bacterium]HRZ04534.1 hypothetical protein [Candidatus Omnitrophota bacterium]HSA37257.1 hypothetical protein [Candidatus Paceibacterota bacterium]